MEKLLGEDETLYKEGMHGRGRAFYSAYIQAVVDFLRDVACLYTRIPGNTSLSIYRDYGFNWKMDRRSVFSPPRRGIRG